MFTTNLLNIKRLNSTDTNPLINTSLTSSVTSSVTSLITSQQWLEKKVIDSQQTLFEFYNKTCQKYQNKNKWILMINPDDELLLELSRKNKVDVSRILRVNINVENIDLNCLEKALSKGNCSAVIVSNSQLKQSEIKQLNQLAKKGKTPCIILENNITIH